MAKVKKINQMSLAEAKGALERLKAAGQDNSLYAEHLRSHIKRLNKR